MCACVCDVTRGRERERREGERDLALSFLHTFILLTIKTGKDPLFVYQTLSIQHVLRRRRLLTNIVWVFYFHF